VSKWKRQVEYEKKKRPQANTSIVLERAHAVVCAHEQEIVLA
jgi:hypothetical protein